MTPTHYFTHRGRPVRLFKRHAGPGAAWYLQRIRRGKKQQRSLGTPLKGPAVEKARILLDAMDAGNLQAARLLMQRPTDAQLATIGQVVHWAECAHLFASELTRRNYIGCLRTILRRGLDVTDPDTLSTAALTPETVRAYFRDAMARAKAAPDQEHAGRILRTANSTANQAACLFTPRMLGDMKDAGLALPDVAPFLTELEARRIQGVARTDWRAPDDATRDATLAAWRALTWATEQDRNTWLAIWLMLSCGLRAGEVSQVGWDWLRTYDGKTWLSNEANVKDHTGRLHVQPFEPWWSEGLAVVRERTGGAILTGPMLTGNDTERLDYVFRRVGVLMRACGWRTQKTNHALRAWAGAVAVEQRGIYGASQFLRHKSVTVTERHYKYLLKKP